MGGRLPRVLPANPNPCPLLEVTKPGDFVPCARRRRPICGPICRAIASGTKANLSASRRMFAPVAGRLREFFDWLFVHIRAGLASRGHSGAARGTGRQRAHVSHESPVCFLRRLSGAAGCFHASHEAGGRGPRDPDHHSLRRRARRAVHVGGPSELGIADLGQPDYGSPVPSATIEVPVFWACGVTPQAVLERARLPLAITHAPGCMFVTDVRDDLGREIRAYAAPAPGRSLTVLSKNVVKKTT